MHEATVMIEIRDNGNLHYATMYNFSGDGMYCGSDCALKSGTAITIRLNKQPFKHAPKNYLGEIRRCEELEDERLKYTCVARLARETKEASLCESAGPLQVACEILVAEKTGDTSLCEDKTGKSSDLCYKAAAYGSLNSATCGEIASEQLRDDCYFDIAGKKGDPDICEKTKNKEICEAVAKGTAEDCDALGDEDEKEICVHMLAVEKNDVKLCKICYKFVLHTYNLLFMLGDLVSSHITNDTRDDME